MLRFWAHEIAQLLNIMKNKFKTSRGGIDKIQETKESFVKKKVTMPEST